jgi:hypothetical protein
MPDRVTYYAVVSESRTGQNPSGLARRRYLDAGGFEDEALQRDLSWRHTSAISEWDRDAMDFGLVEISEAEAEALIERFREKWGQEG